MNCCVCGKAMGDCLVSKQTHNPLLPYLTRSKLKALDPMKDDLRNTLINVLHKNKQGVLSMLQAYH